MTTPGQGWGNPVVGGTALRIPAITSPNFNLTTPAASPTPSWAILQSGLAYLFGVTLSGGTITGPDYIINTQGIFFYSGTPASGNLIAWFAPAAGTDGFGNAFTEGLNVGGMGQNIALLPLQNSAFNVTAAIAGTLEAVASLGTADGSQVVAGLLGSLLLGTSTATKETTAIGSPLNASTAAYILLEGENDGGTDTAVITMGTVTTPDSGVTLVYTPVATFTPYAFLLYGASSGIVVVTKTSGSGNIAIPVGVSTAKAECWAGGGGGSGNLDLQNSFSSGFFAAGGGGEYAAEPSLAVTGGGNVAYVVGAGGTAGTGGAVSGNGGNSTLTGTSVTVTAHSGFSGANDGVGGTGSTNTTHFDGGPTGINLSGFAGLGGGGSGGTAASGNGGTQLHTGNSGTGTGATAVTGGGPGGNGGNGTSGSSGATAGSTPSQPGGGGGSGGTNGGGQPPTAANGAAGAKGQVRLTYSSGAPTILLSVASASGTDQFGTSYPAGMELNANLDLDGNLDVSGTTTLNSATSVTGGLTSDRITSTGGTAGSPTNITTDTWHAATLTNSGDWTAVVALSYKLNPDNSVSLVGELNSTGIIATSRALATLPAGYRPLSNVRLSCNYNTGTSTVGAVLITLNSSGNLVTIPSIPASSTLNIECQFRTDL